MAAEAPAPGPLSPLGLPWGSAAELGVETATLEAATGRLRAQVDAGRLPGFVSCVVKEGRLVHLDSHGVADLCAGLPVGPDVLFRLYSQTKPLTVVAALQLMERGKLGLDHEVSQYIPSFSSVVVGDRGRQPLRQILIRDLLAHTSGIGFGPGFFYPPENDYEKAYVDVVHRVDQGMIHTLAEWCDEIAKLPLRFQPGKDWGYGYSSDILGRIVEIVSGQPLDEYLKSQIIDPLGMQDTFFAVPPEKAHRLSALYKREPWDGSGNKKVKFVTADPGGSGLTSDPAKQVLDRDTDGHGPTAPSASVFLQGRASGVIQGGGCVCSLQGGLVSTLGDFARFGQMLLDGGIFNGVRILEQDSVALLFRDWLNDHTTEKRRKPLWVWGTPGIGFSPLGQIGVLHPQAKGRRVVGAQLDTIHWGGAGGSGYMLNRKHKVLVLTYTGCTLDTATQKLMWRAAFGALRSGRARPVTSRSSGPRGTPLSKKRGRNEEAPSPGSTGKRTPMKFRRPSSHSARKE